MEITVVVAADLIELNNASLNLGMRKTAEISEPTMFISIIPKGQITVIKRKTPMSNFTIFEW